jgi:hypothetical protein
MTIGSLLVVVGDSQRGIELVDEAMEFYARDRPPGTYYVSHSLQALTAGDYDRALEQALRIDVPEWVVTPMLVAASAGLTGRQEIAERAVQRLLAVDPEFALHARAQIDKWHPHETVLERMLEGLQAAGLDLP